MTAIGPRKHAYGFSLIELVLAIFLASILSLSLFNVLRITRRGIASIVTIIDVDTPLSGFYNQMEKDITGMFAPQSSLQAFIAKTKPREQEKADRQGQEQAAQQKKLDQQAKSKQSDEKKSQENPIKNVFVLDAQKERFFWSFITTGGVQFLNADGTPHAIPFIRRVAYSLEKDPAHPSLYRLMYRFSGAPASDKAQVINALDVATIKNSEFKPSYELLGRIKQWEMECTVFEIVERAPGEKEKSKSEQSQGKVTTIRQWNEEEVWSKYKTLIPAFIRVKGIVQDATGRDHPFELMSRVYAFNPYQPKEEESDNLFDRLQKLAEDIFGKNGKAS